jgi:hypothetical protein
MAVCFQRPLLPKAVLVTRVPVLEQQAGMHGGVFSVATAAQGSSGGESAGTWTQLGSVWRCVFNGHCRSGQY